jgi:SH3-like domain-containing protein
MLRRVFRQHRSEYPDPVSFASGEALRIGDRDTEYPGWIWVAAADGREGWAPEQYLDLEAGVARVDYTARELDVDPGEQLVVLKRLNDWAWVRNAGGECGWVPLKVLAD